MTIDQRKIYLLHTLSALSNCLLEVSEEVVRCAIEKGLIEKLLEVLDNRAFCEAYKSWSSDTFGISLIVFNLNQLILKPEQHKIRWHNADAIRILKNALKTYPTFSRTIYETLIAITFDNELEELVEMNEIIDKIVNLIINGVIKGKDVVTQTYKLTDEIDKTIHQVTQYTFFLLWFLF